MFQNPPDSDIRDLLTTAETVAVVGASSKANRPSHGVMRRLLTAGYHVIPVNPHEQEVLGQKAYASLGDVPEPIDIVDVFRRADQTPPVADEAVRVGAKVLWLQLGIANDEAAERAAGAGLTVVMDRCIAVDHTALGVPPK